ncbi:hypothetical protein [Comamonas sp. GB3 AK4-5]|uniref:hypothetical protein n=1 Tax=Comamonas sp. GB3 AK4-5 TaxID=3231487 RepID=UPI00351E1CAD
MPLASLTHAERTLLERYQRLAGGSLAPRLAVEIIPPLVFVGLWAWSGKAVFLLALIAVLVVFNVWRVLQQRRALRHLQSIAVKALVESSSEPAAAATDALG